MTGREAGPLPTSNRAFATIEVRLFVAGKSKEETTLELAKTPLDPWDVVIVKGPEKWRDANGREVELDEPWSYVKGALIPHHEAHHAYPDATTPRISVKKQQALAWVSLGCTFEVDRIEIEKKKKRRTRNPFHRHDFRGDKDTPVSSGPARIDGRFKAILYIEELDRVIDPDFVCDLG